MRDSEVYDEIVTTLSSTPLMFMIETYQTGQIDKFLICIVYLMLPGRTRKLCMI